MTQQKISPTLLLSSWRGSYSVLLLSLLAIFLLNPLLDMAFPSSGILKRIVIDILVSIMWLAALYSVSRNQPLFIVASLLLAPALVGRWAFYAVNEPIFVILSHMFAFGLLGFVATVILSRVLQAERVTLDIVSGAISVYLVIGMAWAFLFASIELFHPGSLRFPEFSAETLSATNLSRQEFSWFTYYSFVTLTTVGYGDITPITPIARALAILEAIIGQFYLTVLIARLMGLHILHTSQRNSE